MTQRNTSQLFSTEVKVLVNYGDLHDMTIIRHADCETVRSYDYEYERTPYNTSYSEIREDKNRIFKFTLRIRPDGTANKIYEMLASDTPVTLTFFFNSVFDDNKVMIHYDSAMVVTGFVASVDEVISVSEIQQRDDTLLSVSVMANSLEQIEGNNSIMLTL